MVDDNAEVITHLSEVLGQARLGSSGKGANCLHRQPSLCCVCTSGLRLTAEGHSKARSDL